MFVGHFFPYISFYILSVEVISQTPEDCLDQQLFFNNTFFFSIFTQTALTFECAGVLIKLQLQHS